MWVANVALTKGLLPVLRFSFVSTIPRSLLRHLNFTAYYVKAPVFQRKCKMENSGALAYLRRSKQNDSDQVRDITPWSGVSTEKLTAAQLSNKIPAFYRHNRSTTRTAGHRSTSSARQLQFTQSVLSNSFKFLSLICLVVQMVHFLQVHPLSPVWIPFPLMLEMQLRETRFR